MSKVPSEHEFYFAVGSPDLAMSSLWRVWTWPNKLDVYVAQAGLTGSLKASLHGSGKFRIGLSEEFVRAHKAAGNWTRPERALDKWDAVGADSGLILPLKILIPSSELRPPAAGWSTRKPVRWLPTPLAGHAWEIRLYLGNSSLHESITIRTTDGVICELWTRRLVQGWVLVLVAKCGEFAEEGSRQLDRVRASLVGRVPESGTAMQGRLRIVAGGVCDDGSRQFIDMAGDDSAGSCA